MASLGFFTRSPPGAHPRPIVRILTYRQQLFDVCLTISVQLQPFEVRRLVAGLKLQGALAAKWAHDGIIDCSPHVLFKIQTPAPP